MLAFVMGIVFILMSMRFSAAGFGISVDPEYSWIGLVFAAAVTIYQIIWNSEAKNANLTIFVVGLITYVYGIATNIVGLNEIFEEPMSIYNIMTIVKPVTIGLILEITPEPLLIWALTGNWAGDFFGNLVSAIGVQGGGLGKSFRNPSKGFPTSQYSYAGARNTAPPEPDIDEDFSAIDELMRSGRMQRGSKRKG